MCCALRGEKKKKKPPLTSPWSLSLALFTQTYASPSWCQSSSARGKVPNSYHTVLQGVMMPERDRGKMTCFLLENVAVKHYKEQDCVYVVRAIVGLRARFSRTKKTSISNKFFWTPLGTFDMKRVLLDISPALQWNGDNPKGLRLPNSVHR